jgi:transcriptional regulator GlxA family with amidase domain
MIEIGLCQYPGAQLAAIYGLTDLFMVANRRALEKGMPQSFLIRTSYWTGNDQGDIYCSFNEPAPGIPLQFVIVPPTLHDLPTREFLRPYVDWFERTHANGTILCSVCVGAFVLAETGLLNGRPATTHWDYIEPLRDRFPDIEVTGLVGRKLVIDDGDVITAAGVMSWTDLGLWIVARVLGSAVAEETATFLSIPQPDWLHPNIFNSKLDHGDEAILRVQHRLQLTGAMDTTIVAMAATANLEPRTFLRRFVKATGIKPSIYAQQIRVKRAIDMLESTNKSVDQIAWLVGYKDTRAFCKIFIKHLGVTPANYRNRLTAKRSDLSTEKDAATQ